MMMVPVKINPLDFVFDNKDLRTAKQFCGVDFPLFGQEESRWNLEPSEKTYNEGLLVQQWDIVAINPDMKSEIACFYLQADARLRFHFGMFEFFDQFPDAPGFVVSKHAFPRDPAALTEDINSGFASTMTEMFSDAEFVKQSDPENGYLFRKKLPTYTIPFLEEWLGKDMFSTWGLCVERNTNWKRQAVLPDGPFNRLLESTYLSQNPDVRNGFRELFARLCDPEMCDKKLFTIRQRLLVYNHN